MQESAALAADKLASLHVEQYPVCAYLTALFLVAGCAHFEAKPLSPEKTAAQFEARTLDSPELKGFLEENLKRKTADWPLPEWDFGSLTLAALFYHPSLDVARAQWAVAQAGIKTAGGRPNPAGSVAPQYTTNAKSGVSPWVVTLGVEPVIETAGKRGYRVEQARRASEAARLNLAAQAWQVRSRLRSSALDHAASQERVRLLQQALDAQQQIVSLLEGRSAAGAIAATEVTTARVALIKTQTDLVEAKRQAVESLAAVAEGIGLPLRAVEGRRLRFDLAPSPDAGRDLESAEVRRQALLSRADILAALAEYAASQSALQLEVAKQYPDIRLGPGYEYDQGAHKWGLGVGAELPILNRNEGPIAEAEAKRTEIAARFLALQGQVIAEIDHALSAREASRDQLRQVDALLDAQHQRAQSVEAMVKAGGANQLELRSVQLEVSLAELARLDALVKVQQSLGRLEEAVQVPFDALRSVEQDRRNQAMSTPSTADKSAARTADKKEK